MAWFKEGDRVRVRQTAEGDAELFRGQYGTVNFVVEPNSDPEVYKLERDNGDDIPCWFFDEDLEECEPPTRTQGHAP